MKLADSMKESEDDFTLLLNYMGKFTFTQEPCVYGGRRSVVYAVIDGPVSFFIVTSPNDKRSDVFDEFEKFRENMTRNSSDGRRYSALLVFSNGRLLPAFCIDHEGYFGTKSVLIVFGTRGETTALGYEDSVLEERITRALRDGVDLHGVRMGDEDTIRRVFGNHTLAFVAPPGEEDGSDGNSGDDSRGDDDAAGGGACGGAPADSSRVGSVEESGNMRETLP